MDLLDVSQVPFDLIDACLEDRMREDAEIEGHCTYIAIVGRSKSGSVVALARILGARIAHSDYLARRRRVTVCYNDL